MTRYEFKVIPAPRRGEKSRDAKTTEDRFALALSSLMNQMGRDGWDYVRAETLPCDERSGFTGVKTTEQNMLVFRRILETQATPTQAAATLASPTLASPTLTTPAAKPADAPRLGPATETAKGTAPALGPADPLAEKG